MTNQNEIISALKLLKQICEEQDECDTCPFKDDDTMPACQIQHTAPCEWQIKNESTKWRAFD